MEHSAQFKAYGHPNISARQGTTIMITKDDYLTPRGDCIIAINADKGLTDLDPKMIKGAQDEKSSIRVSLKIGEKEIQVSGRGHPKLSYTDPKDMVIRKSSYTDGRTLMIEADMAAIDIPDEIVQILKDPDTEITVKITVNQKE